MTAPPSPAQAATLTKIEQEKPLMAVAIAAPRSPRPVGLLVFVESGYCQASLKTTAFEYSIANACGIRGNFQPQRFSLLSAGLYGRTANRWSLRIRRALRETQIGVSKTVLISEMFR
jgi:hypothetical protein